MCHEHGNAKAAINHGQASLEMRHEIYGMDASRRDIAMTLHVLAMACRDSFDIPRAREYVAAAVDMLRNISKGSPCQDLANNLHLYSLICLDDRDMEAVERHAEEALEMNRIL